MRSRGRADAKSQVAACQFHFNTSAGHHGPPVAPPAGAYGQHGGFDPAPVEPFDRQNTARIEEIARGMTIKERHKLAGDDFLKVEDENVARPHFAEGT